jgi:hypothetical protein
MKLLSEILVSSTLLLVLGCESSTELDLSINPVVD